jgi:uncharacterized protein YkuJ
MRIYIFLVFSFIHFSGIAQKSTSELRLLEPDPYRISEKFKKITNLRSEKFIYTVKKKENNFRIDTIFISTYDKFGNETEKIAYEYNKVDYTVKKKFNRKGNKIHSTVSYRKKPESVNATVLKYNSAHKLVELKGFRIKGKDTLSSSFTKFKYENNALISKEIYNQDRFVTAQHFKHDDKRNLTYMHTGEKPETGTYIEYIYDDKSQIINKLEYVKYINSDEKYYLYKSKFIYNEEGKMIKDSVYSESKKHWTVTDYQYNKNGLLAKIDIKRNDYYRNALFTYADGKIEKMKVLTNYNLSLKLWLKSNIYSAKMPATYEEHYTYDKNDRIKSTKIYINGELQSEYIRDIYKL